jgi:hypothetical protein
VCPELHSRCQACHCRGHYATTLVRGDGKDKAVCPRFPSTEIEKLTVREIQMGFEVVSASRGLLTKYRHSLPACGFYPCNTDHHVGIIRLISYAKLNCMKTEKAVAMLENMYRVFWKDALIMTSRYPRERAEVDRKKRRAADTTLFRFHVSLVYNRLPIRNNVSKSFRIFRIVVKGAISEHLEA